MKILKLIDGKEYLLDDSEIDYIKEILNNPKVILIPLSNGDLINKSSISRLGELDKIPHWDGYPLNKDGKSFSRDGRIIYLEADNFNKIEYEDDPKYQAMPRVGILQISDEKK